MTDIIWGNVTKIISRNTFELSVTHQKEENKETYSGIEIIEFTETDIMSIPADESSRDITHLEQSLKDKFIRCDISSRNNQNQLICKVSHSGAGGY